MYLVNSTYHLQCYVKHHHYINYLNCFSGSLWDAFTPIWAIGTLIIANANSCTIFIYPIEYGGNPRMFRPFMEYAIIPPKEVNIRTAVEVPIAVHHSEIH